MSGFNYEDIKDDLEMVAQDNDDAGYHETARSYRHYIAAIEALQAEAELGAKIAKLTGKDYTVDFMPNCDYIRHPKCPIASRIMRNVFEGEGYGDAPLEALNNAIDALGEMEE